MRTAAVKSLRRYGSAQGLWQKGVIGPKLFAILVIMAIVTTLMASPVFEWVYGKYTKKVIDPLSEGLDA